MREWLKKLRISKGLSQQNVSDSINVTQQYYGYIENGDRQKDLDMSMLLKLSKLFDVSVDYIIAEEEKLKSDTNI
ncbi:MAG: helix-turn-helix transcriptional regulator [Clostridia bacterium]|nr:helix-turn-helix transcriptional regulator [Clostridia bacterium]